MAQLPKSLVVSFDYINNEVSRLMHDVKRNPLTSHEWDKINALLALFSEDIKNNTEFVSLVKEEELNTKR